jgi:hypothetical protein
MAPKLAISDYFVSGTRDNGETFVTLRDDRPEWLQDAVRDAHRGTLPNDWIYAECLAAVEAYDDSTIVDDAGDDGGMHEYADSRVDVYTKELYRWAAAVCLTDTWAEAEAEARETGMPEETERRIACIQYHAIRYIAEVMRNACADASTVDAAGVEP